MATTSLAQGGQTSSADQSVGKRKFSIVPYLFILPHLLAFLVFVGWPFIFGLAISFFQYDYHLPDRSSFVGLDNYLGIFNSQTPEYNMFWTAFVNTLEFVVMSVPPLIVIPLLLAVLLNKTTGPQYISRHLLCALGTVRLSSRAFVVVDFPEHRRLGQLLPARPGAGPTTLANNLALGLDFDPCLHHLVDAGL